MTNARLVRPGSSAPEGARAGPAGTMPSAQGWGRRERHCYGRQGPEALPARLPDVTLTPGEAAYAVACRETPKAPHLRSRPPLLARSQRRPGDRWLVACCWLCWSSPRA